MPTLFPSPPPFYRNTHPTKQKDINLFYDCPGPDIRFLGLKEATTWAMLGLIALTLIICLALPRMGRVGRIVPASLVAIVIGTAVEWGLFRRALNIETRTVGDTAALGDGLPGFHWPVLPSQPNWGIIWAYAISLCLIGGACWGTDGWCDAGCLCLSFSPPGPTYKHTHPYLRTCMHPSAPPPPNKPTQQAWRPS